MDAGLLMIRLLLAVLLTGHAVQKTTCRLGGSGLARSAEVFETWGFRPGRLLVSIAAVCELVGSVLFALGLLTPLASAVVVGTMIVASAPNIRNVLWAHMGGSEVPCIFGVLAAALAMTGPGRFSLDSWLELGTTHRIVGPGAILIGLLAAIPPLIARRRALQEEAGRVPERQSTEGYP